MGIPKFYNVWFKRRGFGNVVGDRIPFKVSSLAVDMNGVLHEVAQKTFRYGDYEITEKDRSVEIQKIKDKVSDIRDLYNDINYEKDLSKQAEQKNKLKYEIVKLIGEENYQPDMTFEQFLSEYDTWMSEDYDLRVDGTMKRYMRLYRRNLFSRLNSIFNLISPSQLLVLAVDGVAPQAKIIQQRTRRFGSNPRKGKFNSNVITPGTEFMVEVDEMIKTWAKDISSEVETVIYSSHLVPGEGEHKIMDLARNGYFTGPYSHVIHGLDADLIMLALVAPIRDLFLFRERKGMKTDRFQQDVVDIRSLRRQLIDKGITPTDFVFISMCLGNDFLPHHPSLEDFNVSVDALIDAKNRVVDPDGKPLNLVVEGEIQWDRFYRFLKNMSEIEPKLLLDEYKRAPLYPYRTMKVEGVIKNNAGANGFTRLEFDHQRFRDAWYSNEFVYRGGEKLDLYREIIGKDFEITVVDVDEMCRQYLIGVVWVFNYYTKGMAKINIDWFYPFYHTPLFSDLVTKMDSIARYLSEVTGWEQVKGLEPLNPILQLMSVLPKTSWELIPKKYWKYMKQSFPEYYPKYYSKEYDGKNEDWTAVAILPFVDPKRMRATVEIEADEQKLQYDPVSRRPYGPISYSRGEGFKPKKPRVNRAWRGNNAPRAKQFSVNTIRGRGRGGDRGRGGSRGGDRGRGGSRGGDRGRGGSRGRGGARGQPKFRGMRPTRAVQTWSGASLL